MEECQVSAILLQAVCSATIWLVTKRQLCKLSCRTTEGPVSLHLEPTAITDMANWQTHVSKASLKLLILPRAGESQAGVSERDMVVFC